MRITYENREEFKLAEDRAKMVALIAKTVNIEDISAYLFDSENGDSLLGIDVSSHVHVLSKDDGYFWVIGNNKDWLIAFSKDNHGCIEISHQHHDKSVVENLAKWIACRTGGTVESNEDAILSRPILIGGRF